MRHKFWSILLTGLLATGCEVEETDGGGEGCSDEESSVRFCSRAEAAPLTFTSGEQYLIAPYSLAESGDGSEFTLSFETTAATTSSTDQSIRFNTPKDWRPIDSPWRRRFERQLAVARWTRALKEEAAMALWRPSSSAGLASFAATDTCDSSCTAEQVCDQGSCKSTVTLNVSQFTSVSQTETIDVDVRRKGDTAAILVEQGETVSDADLDEMLRVFEQVILPRETTLFGSPPLEEGSEQPAYDRNADGLIWIVLTAKVEERDAVGFFVATDFTEDASSNRADILYMVPPGTVELPEIFTILAHELQHLLGFGTKVYRAQQGGGQAQLETVWLDEGLSHFAEDACGFGGGNATLLENELASFDSTNMFSSDDTAANRAMALTWVRYIFEQKGGVEYNSDGTIRDLGGAAWLASLHLGSATGTALLNETVPDVFDDYREAFGAWVTLLALDGRTNNATYRYQALTTDPINQRSVGLTVRGDLVDGEGATVTLEGPLETDLSPATEDLLTAGSFKLYRLAGQTNDQTVTLTTEDPDIRYAVIKLP